MPDNSLSFETPYHKLAWILHEMRRLAVLASQIPASPKAPPTFDRIAPITNGWGEAKSLARRTSESHGIPFATFDPVLIEAEKILQELMQVAAGNKDVPFSYFDRQHIATENRLNELGETYAGKAATSHPNANAWPPSLGNPFRAIRDYSLCVDEEICKQFAAQKGEPQGAEIWGERFQEHEAKSREYVQAGIAAADVTGYPIMEVERRLNDLADATIALALWQRDAPRFTAQELAEERARYAGFVAWQPKTGPYIFQHRESLYRAFNALAALAVRFETKEKAPNGHSDRHSAAVDDLLQVCRAFVDLEQHTSADESSNPIIRAWENLSFAAVLAGAPADLVQAVAFPADPLVDGFVAGMTLVKSERAKLLAAVAALIAWCNRELAPTVQAVGDPVKTDGQPADDDADNKPGIDWQTMLLLPPLSASEIADKLGQPAINVERVLRYVRGKYPACYSQDDNARTGEARFRYKLPDVIPHLQKWMKKRLRRLRANPQTAGD